MLKHGENIVDIMGDEIDRIEMNLSVSKRVIFVNFLLTNRQHSIAHR